MGLCPVSGLVDPACHKTCQFILSIYLIFIYLFGCTGSSLQQVGSLVAARGLLSCGMHVGSSSPMRDRTRGPPSSGARSLIHCATRKIPSYQFRIVLPKGCPNGGLRAQLKGIVSAFSPPRFFVIRPIFATVAFFFFLEFHSIN